MNQLNFQFSEAPKGQSKSLTFFHLSENRNVSLSKSRRARQSVNASLVDISGGDCTRIWVQLASAVDEPV